MSDPVGGVLVLHPRSVFAKLAATEYHFFSQLLLLLLLSQSAQIRIDCKLLNHFRCEVEPVEYSHFEPLWIVRFHLAEFTTTEKTSNDV